MNKSQFLTIISPTFVNRKSGQGQSGVVLMMVLIDELRGQGHSSNLEAMTAK